jgi:Holliday junction DNA helicase RuvB
MIRTPGIERLQTPHERAEDELDATLRPRRLDEFVGQEALKEQLGVSIAAAGRA